MDSANMQAQTDRYAAQAAVQAQSNMIAQDRAAKAAAEMLSIPQEKVDVQLSTDPTPAEIDPATGRRKTSRTAFQSSPSPVGVKL